MKVLSSICAEDRHRDENLRQAIYRESREFNVSG